MKYLTVGLWFALALLGEALAQHSRVYTSNADFDEGRLLDVNHDDVPDQLQLSRYGSTIYDVIWVANTDEGTVSKLDTRTGWELARYRTGPADYTETVCRKRIGIGIVRKQRMPTWVSSKSGYRPYRYPIRSHIRIPPRPMRRKPTSPKRVEKKPIPVKLGRVVVTEQQNVTISPRPCAAAVDLDGHVWVANRGTGTVVKILNEGGIDSNENGVIETCTNIPDYEIDPNDAFGVVYTPARALPWGQDERVIYNIEVGDMDSEPLVLAVDVYNNVWVGLYKEKRYVLLDGRTGEILHSVDVRGNPTSAVIDIDGLLWSKDDGITTINTYTGEIVGHCNEEGCGIAVDHMYNVWLGDSEKGGVRRLNAETGRLVAHYQDPYARVSEGVSVGSYGDIWLANPFVNSITRFDPLTGEVLAVIPVGQQPVRVAIDADKNVWAVNGLSSSVTKIDTETNTVAGSYPVGAGCGNLSDMTGFCMFNITTRTGAWRVIYDSGKSYTPWRSVSWQSSEPDGTGVFVRIRSGEHLETDLGDTPWIPADNGSLLEAVPDGRYLQIETRLMSLVRYASPILTDLTVNRGIDYLRDCCQDQFLLSPDDDPNRSRNETFYLQYLAIPAALPATCYALGDVVWQTLSERPNARIHVATWGSWQPHTPTTVMYEGPWGSPAKRSEGRFSLLTPDRTGRISNQVGCLRIPPRL